MKIVIKVDIVEKGRTIIKRGTPGIIAKFRMDDQIVSFSTEEIKKNQGYVPEWINKYNIYTTRIKTEKLLFID